MTIYSSIVAVPLTDIDFEPGFNGVDLDGSHTLVWCSDHSEANPSKTQSDLDAFVSDYETVDSHENEANAGGEIVNSDGEIVDEI